MGESSDSFESLTSGKRTTTYDSSYKDSEHLQTVDCLPGVARTVKSSSSYEAVAGMVSETSDVVVEQKSKETVIFADEEEESGGVLTVIASEEDLQKRAVKRQNYNVLGSMLIILTIVAFVITAVITFFFTDELELNRDFAYTLLLFESSLPFFITSLQPHHSAFMRSVALLFGIVILVQTFVVFAYIKF